MLPSKDYVKKLADRYGRKEENLLPILENVYEDQHLIADDVMIEIARELDISAARVYGTATFYSFLETKQCGKYVIRVCKTITCMMHGKNLVIEALQDLLKIKVGETTADGLFTLKETNCLGQCHKGPAMLINNVVYTELTPGKVKDIINEYRLQEQASA
ncbi:MAG: NADH-quinone oxidoreductase subunit [Anaerophaga sp.]|uniref:NADH-quinone oxidoreductase subunit NuoE family protein n=1 Tax=Anaerophaga thermohalophila TaxID=177400 RepID=UPI000237CC17|nr:NAD(P)H-dependent oxidoreductase subunit E [Anaerophaga thermohalophila]MDI3520388.1 NADH-quinone oxidoreductase subunit [Anaerophaga sp.]MDK2841115.1 NADH-quinone oxidoreductase subunit [Anaerophaga sp.]MDN5289783.1 NADH-quinone oxidoreductase subunit [Anaerophaga sp.]